MSKYDLRNGIQVVIKQPTTDDAEAIIDYSKALFASTDQLLTSLEEYDITIDAEKQWIRNLNNNPNAFLRVAVLNGEIVGMLFFVPNTKKKNKHTGEFGVNVSDKHQGQGIGKILVETLLDWARENPHIEKVYLEVFATNKRAIDLYGKLGFIQEGRYRNAVKQSTGEYVDVIRMCIETK